MKAIFGQSMKRSLKLVILATVIFGVFAIQFLTNIYYGRLLTINELLLYLDVMLFSLVMIVYNSLKKSYLKYTIGVIGFIIFTIFGLIGIILSYTSTVYYFITLIVSIVIELYFMDRFLGLPIGEKLNRIIIKNTKS
ncbi:MAG: hypothetical protein ACTSSP_09920 [Candidatus Asgardarchaeia archaeon]